MPQSHPDFWRGYKRAMAAAGLPGQQEGDLYGTGGTAAGALGGAAIGAGLGDLIASQTKRHLFNIPIPGTQRVEDAEGRLVGGLLGALAGGYAGHQMGEGYGQEQQQRRQMAMLRRLQQQYQ